MTFRVTCAGNREASFARVAWLTPATSPLGGRPAPLRGPPTCRNGNVPCFSRFAPRPGVIVIRHILEEEAQDATEKTEKAHVPIAVPTGAFELSLLARSPGAMIPVRLRSGSDWVLLRFGGDPLTNPLLSLPVRSARRRGAPP